VNSPLTTDLRPRTTDHALRRPIGTAAFSLVEILVAIALLSIIALGLFAMFNQTQRAFRSSMTQTDVLEAGRAVADMLGREIEQMTPSGRNAINTSAQILKVLPLTQPLPGSALWRTNLLEDFFLLTRQNQTWVGIGYCVRTNDSTGHLWLPETGPASGQVGVGSLYRFTMTTNLLQGVAPNRGLPADPGQLLRAFQTASQPGSTLISNRVCDGVVHFRFRMFATNGFPIFSDGSRTNAWFYTIQTNGLLGTSLVRQAATHPNNSYPDRLDACFFWSNSVPAFLEFELGVLEPRLVTRYNSIGDPAARLKYLQDTNLDVSTRVHLFRQRVPVRNVDPLAYQ